MDLDDMASRHKIRWTWTKGHADHEDNNRCDELRPKRRASRLRRTWRTHFACRVDTRVDTLMGGRRKTEEAKPVSR